MNVAPPPMPQSSNPASVDDDKFGSASTSEDTSTFQSFVASIAAASISGTGRSSSRSRSPSDEGTAVNDSPPREGNKSPYLDFTSSNSSPSSTDFHFPPTTSSPSPPARRSSKLYLHQDSSDQEDDVQPVYEPGRRPSLQHRRQNLSPEVDGLTCVLRPSATRSFSTPSTEQGNSLDVAERSPGSAATATPLASRTTFMSTSSSGEDTPDNELPPLRPSSSSLSTLDIPTASYSSSSTLQPPLDLDSIDITPTASYSDHQRSRQTTFGDVLSLGQESDPYLPKSNRSSAAYSSHAVTWSKLHASFESRPFYPSSSSSNAGGSTQGTTPESEHPSLSHSNGSHSHYFPHHSISSSSPQYSSPLLQSPLSTSPGATSNLEPNSSLRRPGLTPPQPQNSFSRSSFIDHYRTLARDVRGVGVDNVAGAALGAYVDLGVGEAIEGRRSKGAGRTSAREIETTLGAGSFGVALREKVSEVMDRRLGGVELSSGEGEVVSIVEYGALQGQSYSLIPPIITKLVKNSSPDASPFFTMLHQDVRSDFRQYNSHISSSDTSYLSSSLMDDGIKARIFSSFTSKPFAAQVVPPSSVSVGFSLLDLHLLHSPIRNSTSLSSQIDSELQLFLSSRAREFKPSGLLVVGFPMGSGRSTTSSSSTSSSSTNSPSSASFRSKSHADLTSTGFSSLPPSSSSSNGSVTRRNRSDSLFNDQTTPDDVWRQLTLTISVAVQRLVSIGTVKANVAHLLLEVPLWARSSAELRRTLGSEAVRRDWEVVESCGMKEKAESGGVASPVEGEEGEDKGPLSVCHPAYRALVNGTMSRGPYVEHCVAFIKVVYESHLLSVLMNQGGMSRGNAEMTLTALFTILAEKGEEGCLDGLQLDFGVVALRRR